MNFYLIFFSAWIACGNFFKKVYNFVCRAHAHLLTLIKTLVVPIQYSTNENGVFRIDKRAIQRPNDQHVCFDGRSAIHSFESVRMQIPKSSLEKSVLQ